MYWFFALHVFINLYEVPHEQNKNYKGASVTFYLHQPSADMLNILKFLRETYDTFHTTIDIILWHFDECWCCDSIEDPFTLA